MSEPGARFYVPQRLDAGYRPELMVDFKRPWPAALCMLVCCSSSRPIEPRLALEGNATWVCAPGGPERCSDARDNNCNGLADEGCGIGSGLIQFSIAWEDDTDVDLDVTDPRGSPARVGAVSSSGLIKDRDCPGRDERRCRGGNAENVVLAANREMESGQYVVVVRLAPHQEPSLPVPVNLAARLGGRTVSSRVLLSSNEPQRVFTWGL